MKRVLYRQRASSDRMGWPCVFAAWCWLMAGLAQAAVIEDIAFTSHPGAQLEVRLTLDEPAFADLKVTPSKSPRVSSWTCRKPRVRWGKSDFHYLRRMRPVSWCWSLMTARG